MIEPDINTAPRSSRTIRILSYNVHSCVGTDRKLDPGRVTDVIASLKPDIIGLQELDVRRRRSGGIDQAEVIANRLKMDFHFHPALSVEEELYGDALLTALPVRLVRAGGLQSYGEPRGAIWSEVEVGAVKVNVFNTHLGLLRRDRLRQTEELTGSDWIGHPDCVDKPLIVMGDFNSIPSSAAYRNLLKPLQDPKQQTGRRPDPTFPSRFPLLRLDHIFTANGPRILSAEAVRNEATRIASDHLPLLAVVEVSAQSLINLAGYGTMMPPSRF
jgi:endonuclease/exonuclease/phosphatase family metal-dependent hydrolase